MVTGDRQPCLWRAWRRRERYGAPASLIPSQLCPFSSQLQVEHLDALHPLKQLSVGQPKHRHPHRKLRVPKTQMTTIADLAVRVTVRTDMTAGKQCPHD